MSAPLDSGASDAAYLAAIVESSDDAIIGKDLSGVVQSWNRGAELIFGYTAAEMIGRPITVLFPPGGLAEEDLILRRVRAGERVDHHETIRRRKNGQDFPVSVTVSPIRAADGTIVGASKIARDISERHAVHAELLKAKLNLEQVVIERTIALAERDLLLREVYHRVKNNLQVVDSILVMQAGRLTDPAARSALASLRGRIYALGLVHQQLMGSADLRTFDIAPFLRELTSNIVDGAAMRGVSLSVLAEPLEVGLDFAIPLGLLVTELVTNALKHAFPGGDGHVEVSLSRRRDGAVVLVVSDDGTGYEPGAAGAASGLTGGVGGSIIAGLVSQLKATMSVQSRGGTRAEIEIGAAP